MRKFCGCHQIFSLRGQYIIWTTLVHITGSPATRGFPALFTGKTFAVYVGSVFERAQIITGFKYCAPHYYYFPSLVAGLALICTKKTGCVKFTSVLCNFLEPQCSLLSLTFFGLFFEETCMNN